MCSESERLKMCRKGNGTVTTDGARNEWDKIGGYRKKLPHQIINISRRPVKRIYAS